MKNLWTYDNEIKWHLRDIPGEADAFVFVYKTNGGDYAISAMNEGDASGGELEFRDTLRQAKAYADMLVETGRYSEHFDTF